MTKLNDDGKIYKQHEAAFRDVSAWVICKDGERVATVARKTGGRTSPNGLTVYAYVHVIGLPMVRGIARGGGYDMTSAAVLAACEQLKLIPPGNILRGQRPEMCDANDAFGRLRDSGRYWFDQLRDMGYQVWEAV